MLHNQPYKPKSAFLKPLEKFILYRAIQGNRKAHAEIYKQYAKAVFTLAYGITRNKQAAEDITHNSFIQLIRKIDTFKQESPFGLWLRQIAVNESLMYLRKKNKHKNVFAIDDYDILDQYKDSQTYTIDKAVTDLEHRQHTQYDLNTLLKVLPNHVRFVVWLKEIEGFTHEEIAALVGKSPSYSKSLIARAYKTIRKYSKNINTQTHQGESNAC